MPDHDPMCDSADLRPGRDALCQCDLIGRVRTDEREHARAALADLRRQIEALPPCTYTHRELHGHGYMEWSAIGVELRAVLDLIDMGGPA